MNVAGTHQKLSVFARCYLEAAPKADGAKVVEAAARALSLPPDVAQSHYASLNVPQSAGSLATTPIGVRLSQMTSSPADDHPLRYASIMAGLEEALSVDKMSVMGARWAQLKPRFTWDDAYLDQMSANSKTLSGRKGEKKAREARGRLERTYALVREFVDEGRPMSFGRMRALNRALRPPDKLGAKVKAGQYRHPKHSKETDFLKSCVPHRFTSEAVHEFLRWYRSSEAAGMHPIELAARSYQRFVSIHPFSDGNGRTARALMDWTLMKNGYPPAILEDAKCIGYDAKTGQVTPGMAEKMIEEATRAMERQMGGLRDT